MIVKSAAVAWVIAEPLIVMLSTVKAVKVPRLVILGCAAVANVPANVSPDTTNA